jgi:hypothetical protein
MSGWRASGTGNRVDSLSCLPVEAPRPPLVQFADRPFRSPEDDGKQQLHVENEVLR